MPKKQPTAETPPLVPSWAKESEPPPAWGKDPPPEVEKAAKAGHGLGHVKDEPDERDYKARAMLGAPRGLPPEATLEHHVRSIKDQGSTSSCVGHAIGTACDTRLRRLGLVSPEPSRVAIYSAARAYGRLDKGSAFTDDGCYPRHAMKGIRDFGVPAETTWPFDASKINEELPWDVHQAASAFRITQWYRIDSVGHARVEDICNAIAQGYPVVFGMGVDDNFMNWDGKGVVPFLDAEKNLGGHMMCLVGYTTDNSERVFRGVNSWGIGWGNKGMFWAHEGSMKDPTAGDFYVVQVSV